ncbi:hypothetical protein L1283_001769 [Sphingobacterium sp. HSC-15S19]
MPLIIAIFSVSSQLILNRENICQFLKQNLPHIHILSFDLNDHLFTMSIRMTVDHSQKIITLLMQRNLEVKLLNLENQ